MPCSETFKEQTIDIVITVCNQATESCPVFPHAQSVLHWNFEDPAAATGSKEERLKVFRRVRDEIARHIESWITSSR